MGGQTSEGADIPLQVAGTQVGRPDRPQDTSPPASAVFRCCSWKLASLVFLGLFVNTLVALVTVSAVLFPRPLCTAAPDPLNTQLADRSKAVFSSLTGAETQQVIRYLMRDKTLNLVPATEATPDKNYIYSVETYLPDKQSVTSWLDGQSPDPPVRQARAILFMGQTKEVKDYIVWPIPLPKNKKKAHVNRPEGREIPWKARPGDWVEGRQVQEFIVRSLEPLDRLIKESLAPSCVNLLECFMMSNTPRNVLSSPRRHFYHNFYLLDKRIEDYYLYSVPFSVVSSVNADGYGIEKIFYNGVEFGSVEELLTEYDKNQSIRSTPPDISENIGLYGSPRYTPDGVTADQSRRPPVPVYPDGQRFRVDGYHVQWLKWSFNIHPRTLTGAQLFDVRFDGERIAYEMSMQDILVIYGGDAPDNFFKSYFDNGWATGMFTMPLIRSVDCPPGAVYIDSVAYAVSEDRVRDLKDAFCVFEHRNSVPLRRHFSTEFLTWGYRYAFSMPDTVLIFRQILTVWNYDYVVDYEFHQNGMVEAKVSSTGYILVTNVSPLAEPKQGYIVNPPRNARGNLHQHLFNFKLDIDVAGTRNRFTTVDIKSEEDDTSFASAGAWSQMALEETLIASESQSALRYDFNSPKYYVIENKDSHVYPDTESPLARGYRVLSNGFSKVVLPDTHPIVAGGASWAKYQLAVTKQHDNERASTSYFVQAEPYEPLVHFDSFLSNNDSLVDQDLVVWVTVGLHHAPTFEDLPVTATPGKTVGVALSPFNYFVRDPSIHSRDAAVFWNKDMYDMDDNYLYDKSVCPVKGSRPRLHSP